MNDFDPNKLQYYTISPKPFKNCASPQLHKKVFTHWDKFWSKEYESYGSDFSLDPADFYRQDVFTFITYDDEIIATNSLCFFDLNYDLSAYPYLNLMYPEETVAQLKKENVSTIMTLQFLMVDPRFRYKFTKINLAGITVSLSLRHQNLYQVDGTITAARTEVRAADVALKCGFSKISREKIVHNVPVVSMLCKEPRDFPELNERRILNRLWKNRNSFQEGEIYEIKHAA